MTTKTIQASGGDAATLHAFEALLAAANPISDPWIAAVNNEEIAETVPTIFVSYGQTSTNTITFQPQTGEGFADLVDFTSTALDYPTTGARINFHSGAAIYLSSHMRFQGLAVRDTGYYYVGPITISVPSIDDVIVQRNIIRMETATNPCSDTNGTTNVVWANNLMFMTDLLSFAASVWFDQGSSGITLVHNTVVLCKTTGAGYDGIALNTGTDTLFGNAVYVEDTTNQRPFTNAGPATLSGDYNIQNGVNGGATLPGAHTSTSGVITSDLTTPTVSLASDAVDMRPKAGGLLLAFIPQASRWTTGGYADTDIRGQTRVGVDNDCGCFQKTVATGGTVTFFGMVEDQAHNVARTRGYEIIGY